MDDDQNLKEEKLMRIDRCYGCNEMDEEDEYCRCYGKFCWEIENCNDCGIEMIAEAFKL